MKQQFLELIDKKRKEMKDTVGFSMGDIRYRTVIDCCNWMTKEVEKMDEWIPGHPAIGEVVQVFYQTIYGGQGQAIGRYDGTSYNNPDEEYETVIYAEYVTHHRPLPNPPTI